jgi:hypothetical protein
MKRQDGRDPSLITSHDHAFYPESHMAAACGDLAQGMARGGHIPAVNYKITRTDRATPVTSSYPVQARRVAELDLTVETPPEQRLR